jgi:outer membrane protein TolC
MYNRAGSGTQNKSTMTQKLKELERAKRVNDAQRNLRLSEQKVDLLKQKVQEIESTYDTTEVHVAAGLRNAKIELDHAEKDLIVAQKAVSEAEVDPDDLDAIMSKMSI